MTASPLRTLLGAGEQGERRRVLLGLCAATAAAWGYLVYDALSGTSACCVMPSTAAWHVADLGVLFVMWAVMMVAMMLPSAMPMVMMFDTIRRDRQRGGRPFVDTWMFVAGYLVVWTLFSLAATLLQWGLRSAALLSRDMVLSSGYVSAAVLLVAGVFQFTPFKRHCLTHCRSPIDFVMTGWREGRLGAVRMGLQHGLYCTGCCWMLMALLFVLGVMNLWWITALTTFVVLEKMFPAGAALARLAGVALVVWGVSVLVLRVRAV